ncbi:MAG: hypothetical protein ACRCUT_13905, partial [Spirochaetota bacterium]
MEEISYSIEKTKENGYPTISVLINGQKKYLHSSVCPSKETVSFSSKIKSVTQDTVIALGCGIGYHLTSLAENAEIKNLIVIDILSGVENDCILHFSENRISVSFITGQDLDLLGRKLEELITVEQCSGFYLCEHPASMRLFPDFYTSVRRIIDSIIRTQAGNIATKKKFGSLFARNIIKNIENIGSGYPVKSLFGIFKNIPALVISSAPSADFYIE